jgi:predicted nucleic-acid-binding protein
MTAVDTDIVVRPLTGDDARQERAARTLLADDEVWIAKTVLLEANWILRSTYRLDDKTSREGLTKLLGLKTVHAEDEAAVAAALALNARGMDFADALDLSSRPPGSAFASFDRALIRRATRAGGPAVIAPPATE